MAPLVSAQSRRIGAFGSVLAHHPCRTRKQNWTRFIGRSAQRCSGRSDVSGPRMRTASVKSRRGAFAARLMTGRCVSWAPAAAGEVNR